MPDRPYVSLNRALLNLPLVTSWIQSSYWGSWQTEEQIKKAVHNSMCFGLYARAGNTQMGFARVVSDHAANSMLTDMFIAEEYRGQGYGKILLDAVVAHPSVARTICILACRPDRYEFYKRAGFAIAPVELLKRNPVVTPTP